MLLTKLYLDYDAYSYHCVYIMYVDIYLRIHFSSAFINIELNKIYISHRNKIITSFNKRYIICDAAATQH